MFEANILRGLFILIVIWGFFELWLLNKLIGNRRLSRFLWRGAHAIAFWIASALLVTFIQYELGTMLRILNALPTFIFFGYIAWSIRARRKILVKTWQHDEAAEGNELLNEVLDALEIEKEKALRDIHRTKS